MTEQNRLFDSKRDRELIAAGGFFWCEACLVARPVSEQSLDPRYCQGCWEFLEEEKRIRGFLRERDHGLTLEPLPDASATRDIIEEKPVEVSLGVSVIMSTQKSEIVKGKRGPKFTELPDDLIRELAGQGISAKVIADKLAEEYQIFISYKTVRRRLQGILI